MLKGGLRKKPRLEAEQKRLADEEAQRATEQVLKELAEVEAAAKIRKRANNSTRTIKTRQYKKQRN